ncbi:hypothetical protein HNR23_000164 [Nocardiopsis mwathae]|uniref:Uncharacterized protein n=1 Tax=Nocardiopsis mwathae TaxID=1472723 RepID=A0A7X0D4I4_9ACTN|nr:hypothetical protein [Nocardiopsis mwathae]MBB6170104.1 hypothetical protein [Nocardiopsis mwathae]
MRVGTSRVLADDVLELAPAASGATNANLICKPVGKLKESGAADRSLPPRVDGDRVLVDFGTLTPGTWALRWAEPGGMERPILTTDPCYDTALAEEYASRARTHAFGVVRTATGRLRVRVRAVRPHAEVRTVRTTDEQVAVGGFLAYTAEPAAGADVELVVRSRHREGDEEQRYPARLTGRTFTAEIPLRPLAEAHDLGRDHNEWDLWLRIPGLDTELRLGSHVDDIVGKKGRLSFLRTAIGTGAGAIGMSPYYTVKDGLSILGVAVTDTSDDRADEAADDTGDALGEAA